ncbi:hypothetical protein [Bradyrhizobium paxllaeri]|uniref:hypothetical protein n=1 Tax=Bradyrhizobium paxllaeri TaxID=190148 RepID=UPI0011472D31|nr:hypothetical protein [Bradyrhizobium paxllaeri]
MVTPSWQDEPAADCIGVSWFTFKKLFFALSLEMNLRASVAHVQRRTWLVEPRDFDHHRSDDLEAQA